MSEEQLKAFLEKIKSDTELQEKLKEVSTPEAAVEIANAAGFSITADDIQSMQSEPPGDDELESAAGGQCLGTCGDSVSVMIRCPRTEGFGCGFR
ncbi:Nif11-like leader peptide family natural product precursor [Synechococcus sp. UW179A]|uniref:Nif11-like leader peptide family natural product precursor n=1 Tax=Synechococcus sp. UW179A TaxID=2575510 RepID=UPI000E0E1D1A|nr:Nif11-like leader peptide family natural product precursor [Synechococcus sp. UW179A]